MKRLLCAWLLGVACLHGFSAGDAMAQSPSQSVLVYATPERGLNVRASPGLDGAIVAGLARGQAATILQDAGEQDGLRWAQIAPPGGDGLAFVARRFVSETKPAARRTPPLDAACLCPNSRDASGARCGRSSAFCKPGGAQPACPGAKPSDCQRAG